jgi:hypothetical protein
VCNTIAVLFVENEDDDVVLARRALQQDGIDLAEFRPDVGASACVLSIWLSYRKRLEWTPMTAHRPCVGRALGAAAF